MSDRSFTSAAGKVFSRDLLVRQAEIWRSQGWTIVMTNGCFDLLHAGHILTLETARTFGNVLIVAVNSDLSVKRLKGPERPLNKEDDRARVLAALSCVDAVVIFPEDTAENILSLVKPDIYAKGGDCVLDEIPERKVVESFGGKIIITPFLPGRSTTNLIDAFRQ